MSTWSDTIQLNLGSGKAGILANLRGQRFNVSSGANIGAAISAGFLEQGSGSYTLDTTFDDANGDRQGVKFYESGTPGTILTSAVSTNPATAGGGGGSAGKRVVNIYEQRTESSP